MVLAIPVKRTELEPRADISFIFMVIGVPGEYIFCPHIACYREHKTSMSNQFQKN